MTPKGSGTLLVENMSGPICPYSTSRTNRKHYATGRGTEWACSFNGTSAQRPFSTLLPVSFSKDSSCLRSTCPQYFSEVRRSGAHYLKIWGTRNVL